MLVIDMPRLDGYCYSHLEINPAAIKPEKSG